jgi:hypothetical protein
LWDDESNGSSDVGSTIQYFSNLSKRGWSWGSVSADKPSGYAQRDGKRFVVRADEKLTVFLELESEGERGSAVARSLQQLAADFAG